jgi:type IV pilus assembly protein PilV
MGTAYASTSARGFSLLEVMVSVIVICVGLLGIAKMQALSLSNSTTSRQRSLAAIEAAGLASSMHSNRQYWVTAAPANLVVTVTTAGIVSTDPALTAALAATSSTACLAAQCAAAALAAFDLIRWSNSLTGVLPNPTSTVSCPAAAGVNAPTSCTIKIQWTEKAVAINQQEATAAGNPQLQIPDYLLYVEP